MIDKRAFNALKALLYKGASNSQKISLLKVKKMDNPINNTKANNTKASKQDQKEPPANNELLRKELKSLNFSDPEINKLLKEHTPEQIKDKLKVLENRPGIRNPKLYFIKILKEDYPSKDVPVINDNGNNRDRPGDTNILNWVPAKDPLTPEARIKVNEGIAIKAGELAKKLKKGIFV